MRRVEAAQAVFCGFFCGRMALVVDILREQVYNSAIKEQTEKREPI